MAEHHSTNGYAVRAVAYYRMSSDRQETSIPDQRNAVEKYAEQNGYQIIGEYRDEGISGDATEKRLGFQRMIADASKGEFSAILCWDQDRFGRFDSVEAGHWIYPLRQASVKLVSVSDGPVDWNDFTGRVIYNIKQEGKHLFLRDLSRNTLRGKLAAAKRGDWLGKQPYGYKIKNKRLVLDEPHKGDVVCRIFAEYLEGKSLRGIVCRLNAEGIESPTCKNWSPDVVRNILGNPAYVGTYRWNASHQGKYFGVSGDDVRTDVRKGRNVEGDWIVHENHHPPVVEQHVFDEVQRRLPQRKVQTTPQQNGGRFLLTGILKCGKCGGSMSGWNPYGRTHYRCNKQNNTGTCDRNAVKQDELLNQIIDTIEEKFLDPRNVNRLREALHRQVSKQTNRTSAGRIKKQLAGIEAKLAKAERRLVEVDHDLLDVVQRQVRQLRNQKQETEAALKAAETPQNRLLIEGERKVEAALGRLGRLRETVEKADPAKVREFLREAVERVEVWSERRQHGRQVRYRLRRGAIYLRGEFLENLSGSW